MSRKTNLELTAEAYIETLLAWERFRNPNPLGYKIQDTIFQSRCDVRINRSGNRTGKSESMCREMAVMYACVDPLDPYRKIPTPSHCWIICEAPMVDTLMRKFESYLPPSIHRYINRSKGDWKYVSHIGSSLEFRTHDQERRKFQGADLDAVGIDEETREDILPEVEMRLVDRDGWQLWSMTPVVGTTWAFEHFGGFPPERRDAIVGDMAWFAAGLMDNPYIPYDVRLKKKREFEKKYKGQPEMLRIRLYGDYVIMGGNPLFPQQFLDHAYRHRRSPVARGEVRESWSGDKMAEFADNKDGWLEVYELPMPGCDYSIGADVARGERDGDFSCAQVINRTHQSQAAIWHGHSDPHEFGYHVLFNLANYYNQALVVPEINFPGNSTLDGLVRRNYPRIYRRQKHRGELNPFHMALGWETTVASKPMAVHSLQDAIKEGELTLHCVETLDELRRFHKLRKEGKEWKSGYHGYAAISGHDDRVMALALAWQGHLTSPVMSRAKEEISNPFMARIMEDLKRRGIKDPRQMHYGG